MKRLNGAVASLLLVVFVGVAWAGSRSAEYYVIATPTNLTPQHGIAPVDSSVVYDIEGLEVKVRLLSDKELNDRYPKQSYRINATNPYTYGMWKDPSKGYTPARFTVFRIGVFNFPFAKVELDPGKAVLETDQGQKYAYYAVRESDAENSFEKYYKMLAGRKLESGSKELTLEEHMMVEDLRYEERMKLVRESLYLRQEPVFKGDQYEGMLVFHPLHPEVKHIKLTFKHFVLQFDRYARPVKTVDIVFEFDIKQGVGEVEY